MDNLTQCSCTVLVRLEPYRSLLVQVTSINPRFAKVHILYVGSTPLKDRFRGTIR